jgi:hypothetical protein
MIICLYTIAYKLNIKSFWYPAIFSPIFYELSAFNFQQINFFWFWAVLFFLLYPIQFSFYSLSFSHFIFSAHGLSFPFILFKGYSITLRNLYNCSFSDPSSCLSLHWMLHVIILQWRDSSHHLSHAFLSGVLHFIRNNLFWYGVCRATSSVPISLWARFISLHIRFHIREVWISQGGAASCHTSEESNLQSLDLLRTKRRWYDSWLLRFDPYV